MHTEKEYSIFEVAINLFCACLVSGVIIAAVYFFTNPIAIVNAKVVQDNTMKQLIPDADSFREVEGKEGWYEAIKNNEAFAYIVTSETGGFSGKIKLLVAVSKDCKVINYSILAHSETPGLGDNADKPKFKSQFTGKGVDHLVVTKDPSNKDDIQAITGATITSKAVTKGIIEAIDEVKANWGL